MLLQSYVLLILLLTSFTPPVWNCIMLFANVNMSQFRSTKLLLSVLITFVWFLAHRSIQNSAILLTTVVSTVRNGQVTVFQRPTDPWFDAECRAAKRLTRRLERKYASTRRKYTSAVLRPSMPKSSDVDAAKAAWYEQRRKYRRLRDQKCTDFWIAKVESERGHPAKLWESVDKLLGRGRSAESAVIDAQTFSDFFCVEG